VGWLFGGRGVVVVVVVHVIPCQRDEEVHSCMQDGCKGAACKHTHSSTPSEVGSNMIAVPKPMNRKYIAIQSNYAHLQKRSRERVHGAGPSHIGI
jgi:hypothetical protein